MMSCTKHLNHNFAAFFLTGVLMAAGCSEEAKKEDFIARVNDSYLSREEFASMIDTVDLTPAEKDQVISGWIYRELLYQKADEDGILVSEDYKNLVNSSSKELAAAMLIDDLIGSDEIEFSDSDLLEYYEKNKNNFRINLDSYLLNKISFRNEDSAVKFRITAIESDWKKAVNIFSSDSALLRTVNSELIEKNNLYPLHLARIAEDLYPQEISLVIRENAEYYSVVQLLGKYEGETTPPFEIIFKNVEKRYLAEQRKKLVNDYIKEIYSTNVIEIKK